MVALLIFLLILTLVVLIHEAGHFFTAKRFGIKVEEFGFGLPPRLFGIKWGETLYSINWLPIGGFVKLYGEDEAGSGKIARVPHESPTLKEKDIHRAFFVKPVWERAAVVVAGVVMNAILAIVIFYTYFLISGFKAELPLLGDYKFFGVHQQNVATIIVGEVAKNSPAEKAGLQPQTQITKINGKKITTVKQFTQAIAVNKGKEITLTWEDLRTRKESTAQMTPRISPPKNQGALGIAFSSLIQTAKLSYETPVEKIFSGVVHPVNLLFYNFDVLGKIIGFSVEKKDASQIGNAVAGPIGIYSVVGDIIQIPNIKDRVLQLLNLAGFLSISLAFFNVLPIPALDGGRLFFILIEGLTGKKVNQKIEGYAHMIGMVVLLALIAVIAFNDIVKKFTGGF